MEHLTRNTSNDRLINAIKNIKVKNINSLNQQLEDLANRITTVLCGILSSIVSAIIVSVIKQEQMSNIYVILLLLLFITILLLLWYLAIKYIVPYFSKVMYKEKVDLSPKKESDIINQFNCDIMQKLAEINEIVDVIRNTDIVECKVLNFVIALHKLQEIVNFMEETFFYRKVEIRSAESDSSALLMRYFFNRYTVSAVIKTLIHIKEVMNEILENDDVIKNLDGFTLLKQDFMAVVTVIEKLKKI